METTPTTPGVLEGLDRFLALNPRPETQAEILALKGYYAARAAHEARLRSAREEFEAAKWVDVPEPRSVEHLDEGRIVETPVVRPTSTANPSRRCSAGPSPDLPARTGGTDGTGLGVGTVGEDSPLDIDNAVR